jgi:hypothetical protein
MPPDILKATPGVAGAVDLGPPPSRIYCRVPADLIHVMPNPRTGSIIGQPAYFHRWTLRLALRFCRMNGVPWWRQVRLILLWLPCRGRVSL